MIRSKRRPPQGFPDSTVETIIERDRSCCAWCGKSVDVNPERRGYDWSIHHRRPRGNGGTSVEWVNQAANGVLVHAACHATIESRREQATSQGFLVSAIGRGTAVDIPIQHAVHGPVHLLNVAPFYKTISAPLFLELMAGFNQTRQWVN